MLHPLLTATEPPAWIIERLARPERAPLPAVDGFVFDRPEALAAAWGHIARLLREGDIPAVGNRDDHLHRFLAKMHGVGIGRDNAHELYDQFLQASDGAAPEGWPTDEKSWEKINRIWDNPHGTYNAPGSELLPLSVAEMAAELRRDEPGQLPDDRLWDMEDLVNRKPLERLDRDQLIVRAPSGYVGLWFGASQHHKTNFALAKVFELLTTTDARVLYLLGEGIDGMGDRLRAHADYLGRSTVEFRGRYKAFRVPHATAQEELERIVGFCVQEHFKPDVVFMDTLSTSISGLDENNTTASMLNGNGPLGGLAKALGCHLIFIGHGADGKPRGGTGFYNNPDQVVFIKADKPGKFTNALVIDSTAPHGKSRDGQEGIAWYAVERHHGVPIPVPTSKAGYEMLVGDAKWDRNTIAAALGRLGPGSWHTDVVVMEIYARGEMDPEDWQNRCRTLTRRMERANAPDIAHLREDIGGVVKWRVPPA